MTAKSINSVMLKNEDSRPNTYGWVQMDKQTNQDLMRLAIKHPTAMGVLVYLMGAMGRNNALAISQAALAKKVGATRAAVNRSVALLGNHQFIEIINVGNLCIYRVNARVAWQGNRGERYAHFMADVIAFEDEQTKPIDDEKPLKTLPITFGDDERVLVGNEPIEPPDQQEIELP
jgi:hypothetical protein